MSSRTHKHRTEPGNPCGRDRSATKRSSSLKSKPKTLRSDDWADVAEPEERRRIQNRLAQRKFREKTRENKERLERESRNQKYAGVTYQTLTAEAVASGPDYETGPPWGGISMQHVIAKGHETESRLGSARGEHVREDSLALNPHGVMPSYSSGIHRPPTSYGSSGADELYYEDESSYYCEQDYDQHGDGVEFPSRSSTIGRQRFSFGDFLMPDIVYSTSGSYDSARPYDSASPGSSSGSGILPSHGRGHWGPGF